MMRLASPDELRLAEANMGSYLNLSHGAPATSVPAHSSPTSDCNEELASPLPFLLGPNGERLGPGHSPLLLERIDKWTRQSINLTLSAVTPGALTFTATVVYSTTSGASTRKVA